MEYTLPSLTHQVQPLKGATHHVTIIAIPNLATIIAPPSYHSQPLLGMSLHLQIYFVVPPGCDTHPQIHSQPLTGATHPKHLYKVVTAPLGHDPAYTCVLYSCSPTRAHHTPSKYIDAASPRCATPQQLYLVTAPPGSILYTADI